MYLLIQNVLYWFGILKVLIQNVLYSKWPLLTHSICFVLIYSGCFRLISIRNVYDFLNVLCLYLFIFRMFDGCFSCLLFQTLVQLGEHFECLTPRMNVGWGEAVFKIFSAALDIWSVPEAAVNILYIICYI